jgi:hypothetical protein
MWARIAVTISLMASLRRAALAYEPGDVMPDRHDIAGRRHAASSYQHRRSCVFVAEHDRINGCDHFVAPAVEDSCTICRVSDLLGYVMRHAFVDNERFLPDVVGAAMDSHAFSCPGSGPNKASTGRSSISSRVRPSDSPASFSSVGNAASITALISVELELE